MIKTITRSKVRYKIDKNGQQKWLCGGMATLALGLSGLVYAQEPAQSSAEDVLAKMTPQLVSSISHKAKLDASQQLTPQIVTVASRVSLSASLSNQSSGSLNGQFLNKRKKVIRKDGASFIKVHFNKFDIPEGSYVEVRSADGSQVHTYSNGDSALRTKNAESNDDGVNRFSALSIIGDTAIIEYFPGTSGTTPGGNKQYRIDIDHIMQGFPEEEIELMMQANTWDNIDPHSTCGVNERRDVQCWASTHPTEFERTRPVARLLINGSGLCTAWRVGSDNHMFTNNHCVESQSELSNTEVWFNYQRTSCGGGSNEPTTIVTGETLLATDYTLDYTLFSVNNFSNIQSFGHFGLDVRDAVDQERIYIPQHGSGNPKELSIESDQNTGGVCRVDEVLANGRGTNTDIGYMCDTIGGSSGSPVLAASSNNVIALHHFGGCTNQGVRIKNIWPQVSSYFGGVIPDGDNNPPTGEPTAGFSYSTNELTVSFTDQSSDSDGNITARSWNFGDGSSSTSTNPTHTYASAGSYDVTLTVTDNDGNTDSTMQTVQVSDATQGELTKGVPVTGLSGSQGDEVNFWIDVPANASGLTFDISGGSGDADLYVRYGAEPTTSTYDCRPYKNGNSENCTFNAPQAGRYHVMIRAYSAYSGVSLVANYSDVVAGDSFEDTNVSAAKGEWKHYTLEVAAGATSLDAVITGGSGDADLYVRFGSQPTTGSYDCRPYKWGNEETCNVANPQEGTWYVSVRAYNAYSGLTIRGEVQ
ncbi:pre-peptidase C-terminal domain-containing protein [Aliikangiella sp. G2MR2-5]|uniref:pre-peptidase C-terminal domain-containing protein n=1 Tax=Aliikangiella sp. G2MR2-5 TaxID=2788943 RepID=UPI001FF074DB|nr:pre-peptidase C-terminal domain-containing protein [Aliikangiella sp. G2MR2-5]